MKKLIILVLFFFLINTGIHAENFVHVALARTLSRILKSSEGQMKTKCLGFFCLRGYDLSGSDLRKIFLWSADLSFADLGNANLRGADLSNANLSNANLKGADLSNANLTEAVLHKADLEDAKIGNAILIRADLTKAKISDAQREYARGQEAFCDPYKDFDPEENSDNEEDIE